MSGGPGLSPGCRAAPRRSWGPASCWFITSARTIASTPTTIRMMPSVLSVIPGCRPHRPVEDRADDQQEDAYSDSHCCAPLHSVMPVTRLAPMVGVRVCESAHAGTFGACRSSRRTRATSRSGTARPRDSTTATTRPGSAAGPTGSPRRWPPPPVPACAYANLAVRGCRARDVRHRQLDAALALRPDLASVVVGMNDLLRHDYDADATVARRRGDDRGAHRRPGAGWSR